MKKSLLVLLLAVGATVTAQAQTTSGTLTSLTSSDYWVGKTVDGSGNYELETAANWAAAATGGAATTAPTSNSTVSDAFAMNTANYSVNSSTVYLTQAENEGQIDFNHGSYTISGASSAALNLAAPGSATGTTNFTQVITLGAADNDPTTTFSDNIDVAMNTYAYTNTSTTKVYDPEIFTTAPATAGNIAGNLYINDQLTNYAPILEFASSNDTSSGSINLAGGIANNGAQLRFSTGVVNITAGGATAAANSTITLAGPSGTGGNILNVNASGGLAGTSIQNISSAGGTINFGATNAIVGATQSVANLSLNGNSTVTFNLQGYSQAFGTLSFGLTPAATATILDLNLAGDFGGNGTDVSFSNSASQYWAPTTDLVITNYTQGQDIISFGTNSSGLTSTQLGYITVDGLTPTINGAGDLVIAPEPSTWSLMIMGAFGLVGVVVRARRKSMY